jgi:uncharacterized protein
MSTLRPRDPVLARFRTALAAAYGSSLERVVLYGSRARSEARCDSDYDVAVFLRGMADRAAEMNRLAGISTDILHESGECIYAMPFSAGAYNEERPSTSSGRGRDKLRTRILKLA